MEGFKLIFLLLLIGGGEIALSEGSLSSRIIDVILDFARLNSAKNLVKDLLFLALPKDKSTAVILSELQKITTAISELKPEYEKNSRIMIETMIERLQIIGDLRLAMDHLFEHLDVIDSRYARFSEIYLGKNVTGLTIVESFFTAITSEETVGLDHELKMMHLLVTGSENRRHKLFTLMHQHMETVHHQHCDDGLSSQQHIFNLFNNILLREMNAFMMIVTGYLYLQNNNKGDYTNGINIVTASTKQRLASYAREAQGIVALASRDIRRCGPTAADRSGYAELIGPFQGIIIDDATTNAACRTDHNRTCAKTKIFNPLNNNDNDICVYNNQNYCLGQSCYKEMTDCESIDNEVTVCEAEPETLRRYDYVRTGRREPTVTDVYYRNKTQTCYWELKKAAATIFPINEIYISACDFCMCTCVNNGWKESDIRAIYFGEYTTTIMEPRAVIGVRFHQRNGMIHLQIKQGKVLPDGKIQEGSEEWKPIHNIERRFSKNPESPPEYYWVDNTGETKLEEHLQYSHVSKDFKTVSLGDIEIPKGYLITGVKLQYEGNPLRARDAVRGDPIELQLTATAFNSETGKYADTSENPPIRLTPSMKRNQYFMRTRIQLDKPDVSIDAPKSEVYTGTHQIVDFRVTDYRKDLGQTVVPFFDTRAVETIPSAPLSGIGLYFKGFPGYGGFIAPKAFTFDISDYFRLNLTLPEAHSDADVRQ